MKVFTNVLLFLLAVVVLQNCSDQIVSTCDTEKETPQKVTFTYIQNEVFTPICVSCHGDVLQQGGLDLSSGNAYGNLVNAASTSSSLKRVQPGESQNSYLMKRLRGENGETVMPPSGKLSGALIDSIAAWIDRGAPQD
ncbi:MAG TPA: hypothetical protein ENK44_05890 [Caldithrix abyssi]|uniref:Cytochrome c domain-containing protein n=1 Tax=Caldithrix abyssi TaxID=187145 RepID=A0A7V4UD08_CALAY|nr:hypothetical protein [Caldithrix abyssi]